MSVIRRCAVCNAEFTVTRKNGNQRRCKEHFIGRRPREKQELRRKWPVLVRQPGCGEWDGYNRVEFDEWLRKGAFPRGTEYIYKGDPGMIG